MPSPANVTRAVRQRAELTFKHNLDEARHGWLRLTPAYSVKVVEQVLVEHVPKAAILDPFSGTATTALCAAMRGHSAVSVDINPFLAWFGNAKVSRYEDKTIARTRDLATEIGGLVSARRVRPEAPPRIANISRWWSDESLGYLRTVKAAMTQCAEPGQMSDLLKIAFCRTLIEVSNAAFNHQSVSFKEARKGEKQREFWTDDVFASDPFSKNVEVVLQSARLNPVGDARVILGDSKSLKDLGEARFDLLITSPPYPNRMSYIRELRPYMYWLDFLGEAREAGELDWLAIGGTWGIATSRLANWRHAQGSWLPKGLLSSIDGIAKADCKSGVLLANYVAKYFEDMWLHFRSVKKCMKPGAKVHYIIGNSKFYDVLVPVEEVYADMLRRAGFRDPAIEVIRKRNSKKELFEFDVTATA